MSRKKFIQSRETIQHKVFNLLDAISDLKTEISEAYQMVKDQDAHNRTSLCIFDTRRQYCQW